MVFNDFLWLEVVERVESIYILNVFDSSVVLVCVKVLFSFMEKKIKVEWLYGLNFCECILKVNFILVFKKLLNFLLFWKGDEFEDNLLIIFEEVYLMEIKYFVCCIEFLVGIFILKFLRRLLYLEMKISIFEYVM